MPRRRPARFTRTSSRAAPTAAGPRSASRPVVACEVCILAGGLSSRMGRDKAPIRLGRRSLLACSRDLAASANLPVRVIRRDLVARCGPLGGVYTALKTTRAEAVLFLACDMPFVSTGLLEKLLARLRSRARAVFVQHLRGGGFPFVVRAHALPVVERLLHEREFSLRALARHLEARMIRPSAREMDGLLNVNTPADLGLARQRLTV